MYESDEYSWGGYTLKDEEEILGIFLEKQENVPRV